jgi:hypothetical protein
VTSFFSIYRPKKVSQNRTTPVPAPWLTLILLMWRIGWAPNSIPIYIQQDATLHSLFTTGNCTTCFGWYFHPSSGAHTTVSTAYIVTPLLLSAAIVEELELVSVCCGWRTPHAATYCVIIQTQRTQISGRNNNGTKHSGGPPEDGREKRPKHEGGFILINIFLTFYWF